MRVKDIKEWCKDKHPEDIVVFLGYCRQYDQDYHEKGVSKLKTKYPKKTDFKHEECKFCEEIEIKGTKRLWCNKKHDIIHKYNWESCEGFEHKDYKDMYYSD